MRSLVRKSSSWRTAWAPTPLRRLSSKGSPEVWFHFMQWVATVGRHGADAAWVDRHVAVVANLGGPLLGAMGPLTSLLSGESHMGAMSLLLAPLLRNLLGDEGQTRMRDVARTWGSLYEILPKGAWLP